MRSVVAKVIVERPLWYEVELTSLPADGPVFDIVLKKHWPQLSAAEFQKFYGRQVCAIRKRQLNKKEIRRLPVETYPSRGACVDSLAEKALKRLVGRNDSLIHDDPG